MSARETRPLNDPVGCWWGVFPGGEVWPVEIVRVNPKSVVVRHPDGKEIRLRPWQVYDSEFHRPEGAAT